MNTKGVTMKTPRIGKTEYLNAIKRHGQRDGATNEILYYLCQRFPNHAKRGEINAKLFIIGRTYATGIERAIISPKNGQGGSIYCLSDYLFEHCDEINAILRPLKSIKEPLNVKKLLAIIEAHGKLVSLIRPIMRKSSKKKSLDTRSFVSKYLHFHCPAVPIYDNNAANCLRRLVPWRDVDPLKDTPPDADHSYIRYVTRFLKLYQEAMEAGLNPTVKHVDAYLIDMERDRKSKGASA